MIHGAKLSTAQVRLLDSKSWKCSAYPFRQAKPQQQWDVRRSYEYSEVGSLWLWYHKCSNKWLLKPIWSHQNSWLKPGITVIEKWCNQLEITTNLKSPLDTKRRFSLEDATFDRQIWLQTLHEIHHLPTSRANATRESGHNTKCGNWIGEPDSSRKKLEMWKAGSYAICKYIYTYMNTRSFLILCRFLSFLSVVFNSFWPCTNLDFARRRVSGLIIKHLAERFSSRCSISMKSPQNKHTPSFKQRNEEMMGSCNFGQFQFFRNEKMIRSSQWVTIVKVPMNREWPFPKDPLLISKYCPLTRASTRTSSHQPSEDPDLVVLWFGF